MITKAWSARWEHIIPFLSLPADLRTVYTTNSIENLNRQIRKAIKTRGTSPTNRPRPSSSTSRSKAEPAWQNTYHWPAAIRALKIHFADRIPD